METLISSNDIQILIITIVCAFALYFLSKHYFFFINDEEEDSKELKVSTPPNLPIEENITIDEPIKSETKVNKTEAKDDFTILEGVGPKINTLLHNAGINTFLDLKNSHIEALQMILDNAGHHFKMANPKTWPEQAHLASLGKWEDLKSYQDRLYSGI